MLIAGLIFNLGLMSEEKLTSVLNISSLPLNLMSLTPMLPSTDPFHPN